MATRELQLSSPLIQPAAADASGIAVVNRPTARPRHLLSNRAQDRGSQTRDGSRVRPSFRLVAGLTGPRRNSNRRRFP